MFLSHLNDDICDVIISDYDLHAKTLSIGC